MLRLSGSGIAMPFQTVASQRLFQQVADQIAGLIRSGELGLGTRLPAERDLSKLLGVSRPTVREAMIALEIAGLVEVRTGAGAYVRQASARADAPDAGPSAFELLAARRAIEGEIAAAAAEAASPTAIAILNGAIERYRVESLRGADCFEADRTFHVSLAEMTGNSVFVRIVMQFWDDMRGPIFQRLGELTGLSDKTSHNIADHRRIRDAVARHNPAEARTAMHDHLGHVETYLLDDGSISAASLSGS
jgi:DNA-binding FadR family transcriptional regulator